MSKYYATFLEGFIRSKKREKKGKEELLGRMIESDLLNLILSINCLAVNYAGIDQRSTCNIFNI